MVRGNSFCHGLAELRPYIHLLVRHYLFEVVKSKDGIFVVLFVRVLVAAPMPLSEPRYPEEAGKAEATILLLTVCKPGKLGKPLILKGLTNAATLWKTVICQA